MAVATFSPSSEPKSAPQKQQAPKKEEKYVSPFGLVEFIFILGFSLMVDAFNLITLYIISYIVNPVWTIALRLIFGLMKVKNAAMWISFASPSIAVCTVYAMEKAKENSKSLAKADKVASGAASGKVLSGPGSEGAASLKKAA